MATLLELIPWDSGAEALVSGAQAHLWCFAISLLPAVQDGAPYQTLSSPPPISLLTLQKQWDADDSWFDGLRNHAYSALLTSRCCQDWFLSQVLIFPTRLCQLNQGCQLRLRPLLRQQRVLPWWSQQQLPPSALFPPRGVCSYRYPFWAMVISGRHSAINCNGRDQNSL